MWELFITFFKIGLFTFGGGYAMLPLLQSEIVEKHKWASGEDLMNYFSIGQCTPGIIAINVATFIGYRRFGIKGAIVATLGMIMPSLIIIILIASMLKKYMNNIYLVQAFAGIRIGVTALILHTLWGMCKKGIVDYYGRAIFIVAAALLLWLNVSAVVIVLLAAFGGWGIKFYQAKRMKR